MIKYERKEKYTKPRNVKELLILAKAKEKASFGFYNEMSRHFFINDDIKKLLSELRDAEAAHIQRIENKLEELKPQTL